MSKASIASHIAGRFLSDLLKFEDTDRVVAYATSYARRYSERLRAPEVTTGDYVAATAFAMLIAELLEIAEAKTAAPKADPIVFEAFPAPVVNAICSAAKDVLTAYKNHDRALCNYFAEYGCEHEPDDNDEDCPEDDTCSCPLVVAMNDSESDLRRTVSNLSDALVEVLGPIWDWDKA